MEARTRPDAPASAQLKARRTWPAVLDGRPQAHCQGVPGGQPHRLGGGAHLLRRSCRSSRRCWCWSRSSGWSASSATQSLIDNLGKVAPGPGARTSSRARSRTCRSARARRACCSSSAWPARSGRPRATSRRSCAPPTRSTTSTRAGPIWKTLPTRVGADARPAAAAGAARHRRRRSPAALAKRGRRTCSASATRRSRSGTSPSGR